jgi:hypothetical protein
MLNKLKLIRSRHVCVLLKIHILKKLCPSTARSRRHTQQKFVQMVLYNLEIKRQQYYVWM